MNSESSSNNPKVPFFRNWLSLFGLVVAIGSLFSFLLLLAMDLLAGGTNPYLGILTFAVAPIFFVIGMVFILLGWLLQRRRHMKLGTGVPFVSIDLTRPKDRRNLTIFAMGAVVFFLFAALGSYHTYHFSESVMFCGQACHTPMNPEYTTYLTSPHAKVACASCHVGPGVTSFVKAKLNGMNQLQATLRNTFHRPIQTPKNLRPAQEICEQCHWPKKYVGNLDRTYAHYLSDETNTPTTVRLLLKVGGGDPTHGPVGGIHWHMNLANKVEYISTNEHRQVIPWVRMTDEKGTVTEFRTAEFKDDPAKYQIRKVDCMDCHNRPAHQFRNPNDSVDLAMSLGKIDATIPLIKSNLVAILSATNSTETAALQYIETTLRAKYAKDKRIDGVIAEAKKIFQNSIFPEMKADWRTYPDNIGHMAWPGCFRCHDGKHKTADGKRKIEASDCNSCHIILSQGTGVDLAKLNAAGQKFTHPDSSSEGTDADCIMCHAANP